MAPRKQRDSKFLKISISVTWKLLEEFDEIIEEYGYQRSEAIRRGMRMVMDDLRKSKRYKTLAESDAVRRKRRT